MSMRNLTKTLKKGRTDTFDEGTVIRWTSSGRYTYAAIKTAVGWATTAQGSNVYVPRMCTFDQLLEVLGKSEVSRVNIAVGWIDPLTGEEPV